MLYVPVGRRLHGYTEVKAPNTKSLLVRRQHNDSQHLRYLSLFLTFYNSRHPIIQLSEQVLLKGLQNMVE